MTIIIAIVQATRDSKRSSGYLHVSLLRQHYDLFNIWPNSYQSTEGMNFRLAPKAGESKKCHCSHAHKSLKNI